MAEDGSAPWADVVLVVEVNGERVGSMPNPKSRLDAYDRLRAGCRRLPPGRKSGHLELVLGNAVWATARLESRVVTEFAWMVADPAGPGEPDMSARRPVSRRSFVTDSGVKKDRVNPYTGAEM